MPVATITITPSSVVIHQFTSSIIAPCRRPSSLRYLFAINNVSRHSIITCPRAHLTHHQIAQQ